MNNARSQVDADSDAPAARFRRARADFLAFADRVRDWFDFAVIVIGAPFRFVARVGRFFFGVGVGFFSECFNLVIGLIGLAVILIGGYIVLQVITRVILRPLFH